MRHRSEAPALLAYSRSEREHRTALEERDLALRSSFLVRPSFSRLRPTLVGQLKSKLAEAEARADSERQAFRNILSAREIQGMCDLLASAPDIVLDELGNLHSQGRLSHQDLIERLGATNAFGVAVTLAYSRLAVPEHDGIAISALGIETCEWLLAGPSLSND